MNELAKMSIGRVNRAMCLVYCVVASEVIAVMAIEANSHCSPRPTSCGGTAIRTLTSSGDERSSLRPGEPSLPNTSDKLWPAPAGHQLHRSVGRFSTVPVTAPYEHGGSSPALSSRPD